MIMQGFYNILKEIYPEKFGLKEDCLLYHYTTIDTFDKLVEEGGELYCTHYMDLNDDVEFWKGFGYFEGWVSRKCKSDLGTQLPEIMDVFGKLKSVWKRMHKLYVDATWVMSFTTEKDSLSQWRFYTDRTNGGVAIGFGKKVLEEELQKCSGKDIDGISVMLMPCIYYASGVDARLDAVLERVIEKIDIKSPSGYEELARIIQLFSSIIKDSSFESEHEWRIIIQASNVDALKGAKVVGGKARLPLGVGVCGEHRVGMLMKEILLSPHGDKNRLLHSVLLPKYSFPDLRYVVRSSSLPYNGN